MDKGREQGSEQAEGGKDGCQAHRRPAYHVGAAFSKLEFFVVQDIFFSETCKFADVVLPASPSLEKEGTFTSTERRIQRLYQVFEPMEGSRTDWHITQEIANRLGASWKYQHPSEVMDEIASLTPMFAGVNYRRLEGYNTLQWPVAADGSDEPLLDSPATRRAAIRNNVISYRVGLTHTTNDADD